MNVFVRFDDWVVSTTEKGCHAIQRQFGWTNYGLLSVGNLLIAETIISMATFGIFAGKDLPEKYFITHAIREHRNITIFFVVLELCAAFWFWKYEEARAFDRLLNGLANPKKVKLVDRLERLLAYIVVPGLLWSLGVCLDWFLYLLIGAKILLDACDPLPPCRGKFWERLEAGFAKLARTSS